MSELLLQANLGNLAINKMEDVLWYYSDASLRQQRGPFTTLQMQALLAKGELTETTLAWHEEMTAWVPIRQIDFRGKKAIQWLIPAILSQTDPHRRRQSTLSGESASDNTFAKTTQLLFPNLRRSSATGAPEGTISDWAQEISVEGQVYFINTRTGEVAWEIPSISRDTFEECLWIPDAVEGYTAAVLVERISDESLVVKKFSDKAPFNLTARVAKRCLPLLKHELTLAVYVKLTQDLVHIETLNEASVLHFLRSRYTSDLIYTRIGSLLLVVNPYKPLPLYTGSHITRVRNR